MEIKISLMIHTASSDDFLINHGIESYFKSLTYNLSKQTFKDFELIYIDTFYEDNKDKFTDSFGVSVKHVPIHPNHRYWYNKNHCFISAAKNTGIIHAEGELLITCDDAEYMPEHLLQMYWDYYKKGFYMLGLHKRLKSINVHDGLPDMPISGEIYINDHRLNNIKEPYFHQEGGLAFAGTSFSLKDAIILNGFNEKMDGCKSLEDCDFGIRLSLMGRNFVNDPEGFLFLLDHLSYSGIPTTKEDGQQTCLDSVVSIKKPISNFIAIENYGMIVCAKELYDLRANINNITEQHLKIIQRETLKYRHFDPLDDEHKENLQIWLNTPTFNLEKDRNEQLNIENK